MEKKKKENKWVKHCKCCKKPIRHMNKSGYCRTCYIKIWKEVNYNGKKKEGFREYECVA